MRRLAWFADLLATPMTSHARVETVRAHLGCSARGARDALLRARKVLRSRHATTADAEGFEQVERLRKLAADARAAGDFQAQLGAERMLMDIVGTKAKETKVLEVTGPAAALVQLAKVAERERDE